MTTLLEIRPFNQPDYQRIIEIGAAIDPDSPPSLEELKYRDSHWDPAHRQSRFVATRDGYILGWAQVGHIWWGFHPDRYILRIEVDPAFQRQGIGSALFGRLLDELQQWHAQLVRAEAKESRREAMGFLERRGFVEVRRHWESRLPVKSVDMARFQAVEQRVAADGITIRTFKTERARRGDRIVREVYELECAATEHEARLDADTLMSFERFVTQEIDQPNALPDGHFLALDGERLIGLTRLERSMSVPEVLGQGFTCVHPDYRGRGIARTLKLQTVRYAQAHGYTEIRTRNDTTNAPMLAINDDLGFVRQPAVVIFERRF